MVRTLTAMWGLNSVSKTISQSAGLSTVGRAAGCWPTRSSHVVRELADLDMGEASPGRSGDSDGDGDSDSWSGRGRAEEADVGVGSPVRCTANSRGSFTRRRSFFVLPGRRASGCCLARSALCGCLGGRVGGGSTLVVRLGHSTSPPINVNAPPLGPDLLAKRLVEGVRLEAREDVGGQLPQQRALGLEHLVADAQGVGDGERGEERARVALVRLLEQLTAQDLRLGGSACVVCGREGVRGRRKCRLSSVFLFKVIVTHACARTHSLVASLQARRWMRAMSARLLSMPRSQWLRRVRGRSVTSM